MKAEPTEQFIVPHQPRTRSWRLFCILAQQALLIAAVALFVLSLHEPALMVNPWCNSWTAPSSGLECLMWGICFYPSNALLLLLPLLGLLITRNERRAGQIVLAVLSTASTAWVLIFVFNEQVKDIYPGCVHWASAHVLSTLATYVPVHRGRRLRRRFPDVRPGGFPVVALSAKTVAW